MTRVLNPLWFDAKLVSFGEPQMFFSIDAMTEFPEHWSSQSANIVWKYLKKTTPENFP